MSEQDHDAPIMHLVHEVLHRNSTLAERVHRIRGMRRVRDRQEPTIDELSSETINQESNNDNETE